MICRSCLLRINGTTIPRRSFTFAHALLSAGPGSPTTAPPRSAASAASAPAAATAAAPTDNTKTPPLSTPLSAGADETGDSLKPPPAPKSSCVAGTTLEGFNYFKDRVDPIALPDDQYPGWLWKILDREETETLDESDLFSKSKKQRKIALKKAKAREDAAIASGNLDALAPKVPYQHQSINLPGSEQDSIADAVKAAQARLKLRKAMRKENLVSIREQNYIRTL